MPRTRNYEAPPARSRTDEVLADDGFIQYAEQEAWDFVHFLSAHVASLETRAAIIIPAQLAGLIALWTQFFTFEETVPHVLAWIAWSLFMLSLIGAAWIMTPGRIRTNSLIGYGLQARPGCTREEVVRELSEVVQRRTRALHIGLPIAVGLTMLGLALTIVAYAVDKIFYAP
jgi:hypothetical protein